MRAEIRTRAGPSSSDGLEGLHFYIITATITLIAFIAYFVMATGNGVSSLAASGDTVREFYWARYIGWLFTTPLLLLDLALLALVRPGRSTGLDVGMILTGLGAGASSNAFLRVVLFLISTAAFIGVVYFLVTRLLAAARSQTAEVARVFDILAGLTIVLWTLYPVVFLLGTEGFGALGISTEVFAFMVLDLLAKVGFGFLFLTNRDAIASVSGGSSSQTAARVS